jgi:uncharacterized protein (DUF1697 family)
VHAWHDGAMTVYIALLRAVNVGGTGLLPMATLKTFCEEAGFSNVRTYIASGNVVFDSGLPEAKVQSLLEERLQVHAGRRVDVVVRTGQEMAAVLAGNPFADQPGNRTVAIFLDKKPEATTIETATGRADEVLALGKREVYAFYPSGMGQSKLKLPLAKNGTARNMNTVAKLVAMATSR